MSEITRDPLSIRIGDVLVGLPALPFIPSIFIIHDHMKTVNENLHSPKLVSIGPLHHGKAHLQNMEQHKFRYLKLLLQRCNESSMDKYVVAIRSLEEQARGSYASPVYFSSDEFVEMLLLDGCFIIELIRKYKFPHLKEMNDPNFKYRCTLSQLVCDLMLVENQIPFFVLEQLFSMTNIENPRNDLVSLIQNIVARVYPWPCGFSIARRKPSPRKNVDHLLHLMYTTWSSSFPKMKAKTECNKIDVNSAIGLQEAGIKFKKDMTSHLLDIKFVKGVVTVPTFTVFDDTESILRNLILYEHFFTDSHSTKYVTDYAFFLQCLVNSSKDVEILRRRGILSNMLGDNDTVHHMFRRLGLNAHLSAAFSYADVFNRVNAHCGRRQNRWIANLRSNYFNSPWAYISFLAALILLVLTLIQTVFTVLSVEKSDSKS